MNQELRPGDFVIAGRYCAFVAEIRGTEMVLVPVVSAKLGRHRSDIALDNTNARMPIMRPALRCKGAKLEPIGRQSPLDICRPDLVAVVMLAIRTEAMAQHREAGGQLGIWHTCAAAEVTAVR